MKALLVVLVGFFEVSAGAKASKEPASPSVERGRYLTRISGCNDCHTPMYMPQNGNVPEKDWMTGVPVGWKGPWGTTYAANLRKRAASMTEDQWVAFLKNAKGRPPMPYFVLNEMKETDARSLYRFLRYLGDSPMEIPAALPPGQAPQTPYLDMDLKMPAPSKSAFLSSEWIRKAAVP
jgi:hypothetical protein